MNPIICLKMKNPLSKMNIFSRITFAWLGKIFLMGYKRDLTELDIFPPPENESSSFLDDKIHALFQKELIHVKKSSQVSVSLIRLLRKLFGIEIVAMGLIHFICESLSRLLQPICILKLFSYFKENSDMTKSEASQWAAGIIGCLLIRIISSHYVEYVMTFVGIKIKFAVCSLIYKKILRMSITSLGKRTTVGQIVNLLMNDVTALEVSLKFIHNAWIAPLQTILVAYLIYEYVSLSAIAGILIFFVLIPIQGILGKMVHPHVLKAAMKTDERLRLTNETISYIQVIKMFAWENSLTNLIDNVRKKEVDKNMKINMLKMSSISFVIFTSRITLLVSLVLHIIIDKNMNAANVFLLIILYNQLQSNMCFFFPTAIQLISNVLPSIKRIEEFMTLDEIKYSSKITTNISEDVDNNAHSVGTILLKNISAKWEPEIKKEILKNINFHAKNGSIIAVIGQVASGKSSLLQIILQELPVLKGNINVVGKIAYLSQEPWIFSSSIRQNILFTKQMNKERYDEVVKVCQLEKDFLLFPSKDQTIIGEKGINLSGGQKARIALARAVYADADIYLLDDPLSAVDTRVGRLIFEKCICKFLSNKTRVLVTHNLHYLKDVDYIYILHEGMIKTEGTYQVLYNALKLLIIDKSLVDDLDKSLVEDNFAEQVTSEAVEEEQPELKSTGKISMNVYLSYLKSVNNWWLIFFFFFFCIKSQLLFDLADYFISEWTTTLNSVNCTVNWTNDENSTIFNFLKMCTDDMENNWRYVYLYSGLLATAIIEIYVQIFLLCKICTNASHGLHSKMFRTIIRGIMSFFYRNSTGRILNRFSKDMGILDTELPKTIFDIIRIIVLLLSVIILSIISNYWILVPATFSGIILYFFVKVFFRTSRSLKRLDGTTRSPVIKIVNDTLQSLPTIRAFEAETFLTKEFHQHQNLHISTYSLFQSASRCFQYYVDLLFLIYIAIVCYILILIGKKISIGNAGLIISQSLLLVASIKWGFFQITEMMNQMTATERILEFTSIQKEPSLVTKPDENLPKEWPKEGCVEFKNVFLKYSQHGATVLKNVNFIALPNEKIGIVGRTGAGKSSLVAALFRLVYIEGEIFIDGVPTSKLGLHDLRSKISIIPQQPLLFSGTLRRNLDPFTEWPDDILWQALEDVKLKNTVVNMENGLDTIISDGGVNFSVGERQLLCLARAIVKNNKILVLDEATSNVDSETDALIQRTVKNRFEYCTVFIIAHRLNTIMDCDKVMVVDAGEIVEFEQPAALLKKKHGYFYNIVQQSGQDAN